eukprot:CAMPEP_0202373394 /NCGR_PEP_ID=MMETSP1127-20130417/4402_1 /ASSEMBLY_ACC=CAM_ASM_000462 /TAXON_ID=3047 /ORGANISM="Dunaliella tertiolecta, Strain CCMP1320" /LENGTH=83 /DNA_ID=CAMNT_0048970257 /DNA_START=573 /DNA_END=824 /DNA_ORIENTATION=+
MAPIDEPSFQAALASVMYGQNDVDNEGRSRMEDLRVTLDQAAYVSFGAGALSHRGNINVLILDMLRQKGVKKGVSKEGGCSAH